MRKYLKNKLIEEQNKFVAGSEEHSCNQVKVNLLKELIDDCDKKIKCIKVEFDYDVANQKGCIEPLILPLNDKTGANYLFDLLNYVSGDCHLITVVEMSPVEIAELEEWNP